MAFIFQEFLREEFGGRWLKAGDGFRADFDPVYGEALANFLERYKIDCHIERGTHTTITLSGERQGHMIDMAILPRTPGQPMDPQTGKPFDTLRELICAQAGISADIAR